MPHLPNKERSIDWLEMTNRSLESKFSQIGIQNSAPLLTERLAVLLLQRLPETLATAMVELLPRDPARELGARLYKTALAAADCSIGFASFIEVSSQVLGLEEKLPQPDQSSQSPDFPDFPDLNDNLSRQTAECFLWAVTQELPVELKTRMREVLPIELCSRMNLNHSTAEDSRVA
jgi:hypothetical protein